MSLHLGKSFDRCYNLRLPFLDGYYNIGIFYNKRSSFLLFKVDPDFSNSQNTFKYGMKINMFKNLESSKFCETFTKLHSYKKTTLDIVNQFNDLNPDFFQDISFILNESITLMKIDVDDRELFDTLNIYGFTINSYFNEFIFIIAERQNIFKQLSKKIVRTSGLQIGSTSSLSILNEFHKEFVNHRKDMLIDVSDRSDQTIKMNDEDINNG